MTESISVENIQTSNQSYVDLVKLEASSTKTVKVDSFTIMPILNPEKSLFRCEFNGDELFADFKIGIEVEYPFPLSATRGWKIKRGNNMTLQIRSSDGTSVSAIGKIIGHGEL